MYNKVDNEDMRSTELKRVQREGEQLQWLFFFLLNFSQTNMLLLLLVENHVIITQESSVDTGNSIEDG